MSEHTPGPWHYDIVTIGHPDNRINPCISSGHSDPSRASFIARIAWEGSTVPGMTSLAPATFEEAQANARLIAAAPDLLAALKRIETWLTNQPLDQLSKHEMLREAREALTKAKESEE